MRIGVVAGEASGDLLGAGMIAALRARHPDAQFEGVAGTLMRAAGCEAWEDAEALAVMGLIEEAGFALRAAHDICPELLPDPGCLAGPVPDAALERQVQDTGMNEASFSQRCPPAGHATRYARAIRLQP